jgi:NADH-quinone oxidoreductase subunit A
MLFLSYFLGERHQQPGRNIPYESGVQPTGSARLRYGAHFYLVAIFFILFDIEAVIVFAWAVAFRELGWPGYLSAALFIVTLALGLIYIWKEGGLDWNRPASQRLDRDLRE